MPARRRSIRVANDSFALAHPAPARMRKRKQESFQEKHSRAMAIAERMAIAYAAIECPLEHRNSFELLVAVVLSAQCTDAAVNEVTPEFFRAFPDAEKLARASTADIERIIRRLGLFRAKARSLQRCARQLVEQFGGKVPASLEALTGLSGVGRKTANVILGHAYGIPGFAVDTHCRRLSNRLGLTEENDPVKIERDVCRLLPPDKWTSFSHRLIIHGRQVCHARKPECEKCPVATMCPSVARPE